MNPSTLLDAIERRCGDPAANPTAAVVVLHGLGADGSDFVPVVDALDLADVGPVRFVFPHAPVRPVTVNNGYPMRAWYDILGIDLVRREDEAGLRASQSAVEALIAREVDRGIDPSRIVLMGFSQGCAMTLMTGLRHPQRLAGLIGLSGYLPLAATTASERSEANRDVPIFLAHGTQDGVVSIDRGAATRDLLVSLGHDVAWHEYPMPHSVIHEEIDDIARFLRRVLT